MSGYNLEKQIKQSTIVPAATGIKMTTSGINEASIRRGLEQINSRIIKRNRAKAVKDLKSSYGDVVVDLYNRKRLLAFIKVANEVLAARNHD